MKLFKGLHSEGVISHGSADHYLVKQINPSHLVVDGFPDSTSGENNGIKEMSLLRFVVNSIQKTFLSTFK